MMRSSLSVSALFALSLAALPGCSGTTSGPVSSPGIADAVVSVTVSIPAGATGMGPAAYGTNPLVISAGTVVTWTNNDTMPHTATSDTGAFDSSTLAPGQSFSFTFATAGTFPYHCTIHGAQSMSGVIQVTAAPPSPSVTPAVSVTPTASPTPTATPTPTVTTTPTSVPTVTPVPAPTYKQS